MASINLATILSGRFTPEEIPDQTGRVAVVTGGSGGIGYYTALPLAEKGARVFIISSNQEKGEHAADEMNKHIKEKNKDSSGKVEFVECDFSSPKDVNDMAKRLTSQLDRLDTLILNAGVGQVPFELTKSGLPNHFAINNLAHYIIAVQLVPIMQRTVASGKAKPMSVRIVLQSSELHKLAFSNTKFANKEEILDGPDKDGVQLYGRSKLGLIFMGQQLAKRKLSVPGGAPSILAISVHPGTVDTDMQGSWGTTYGLIGKIMGAVSKVAGKSPPEGAEAGLWAAVSPDINETNWQDYQGKYFSEPKGKNDTESNNAFDEEASNNFWELCAAITKEQLGEDLR